MTRRRENLRHQSAQGSEDPRNDSRPQRKKNMPIQPPRPKGPDFIQTVLCDNWKQQSMVKKETRNNFLPNFTLILQFLSAIGIGLYAINGGGSFIAPAIGTAVYTVATINNSFDRQLHGLIGFLDSPFMVGLLCMLLLTGFLPGGPQSPQGYFGYIACCLPFYFDFLVSMWTVFRTMSESRGSATVEEIPLNEEHFISMNEQDRSEQNKTEEMCEPSDRLMPDAIAEIQPLNNLLTSNWKENACDVSNTTEKQLSAFLLILGYFYLGGAAVESQSMVPLGALTLGYATSSLVGYFGLANAPFARLMRVNAISVLCAIMGLFSLFTTGIDIRIAILTVMHIFDAFQGATQTPARTENSDNEFERMSNELVPQNQSSGPIMSFFTESWRVNSFNRSNYDTCKTVQIVMFGAQLYFALIAMINGESLGVCSAILAIIMAGAYSFFSPVRLTAIDAIQSNGSQLAVLGAATHQIVTASPGISFYVLFCLMAVDSVMSCSTFFSEHQDRMLQSSGRALGLHLKDNQQSPSRHDDPSQDGEGYNRQI